MSNADKKAEIIDFPKSGKKIASSTERIWGKKVYSHGYAGIPSILIQAQRRLGINPTQMNIIIQLLDYWHEPTRKPFPTKKDLANRIGVNPKTIQNNIRELEKAGSFNASSAKPHQVTGTATSIISTASWRRSRSWNRNSPKRSGSAEPRKLHWKHQQADAAPRK